VLAHPPSSPPRVRPAGISSMHLDWGKLFGFSVPPLELIIRSSVMFLFLWLLFRVVIKRRIGAMGMAGTYTSISDAVVVVGTIVLWNHFFDWLAFRSAWLQRLLEPSPLLVVHRGQILWRNMRQEFLSRVELDAKLREHGVTDVTQVEKAYVEPDGQISVVKRPAPSTSRR